jgi:hypothetical protein
MKRVEEYGQIPQINLELKDFESLPQKTVSGFISALNLKSPVLTFFRPPVSCVTVW